MADPLAQSQRPTTLSVFTEVFNGAAIYPLARIAGGTHIQIRQHSDGSVGALNIHPEIQVPHLLLVGLQGTVNKFFLVLPYTSCAMVTS